MMKGGSLMPLILIDPKKIDWKMLMEQKRILLALPHKDVRFGKLAGIVNLIDDIQDQAVDKCGVPEDKVFIETVEMKRTVEILQHNIKYWYKKDQEMPDHEQDHVKEMIIEGFCEGQLVDNDKTDSAGDGSNIGWWKIVK